MKYACLVYIEGKNQDHLSAAELAEIVTECNAVAVWDAELKQSEHLVFSAGLQSTRTAVTVRKRSGQLATFDGPFAETKEFLGGFAIIEARDMNEAVQLVSKLRTRMLTIEVRPLMGPGAELSDPIDRKIAEAVGRSRSTD